MLDLLPAAGSWEPLRENQRLAIATIVRVSGSAPRPVGASMVVSDAGAILGSLSGGCVEGAVIESATEVLAGASSRREQFSYTEADAFAVGLTCGGTIEVHIQTLTATDIDVLVSRAAAGGTEAQAPKPLALIRRLRGTETSAAPHRRSLLALHAIEDLDDPDVLAQLADLLGGPELLGDPDLVRRTISRLKTMVSAGETALLKLGPDGAQRPDGAQYPSDASELCGGDGVELLVESRLPAPRFLIFGANDFGAAMIAQAKMLGFAVTLCDPRPAFTAQERFAGAAEVVTAWPHRYLTKEWDAGRLDSRSVVCVLGHDPKFDVPLLAAALGMDLAFVGAMGSRLSHAQRISALLEGGADPVLLATLHSPIGLDIGACTPAEVAVSIASGVIAHRNGRSACSQLRNGSGALHADQLSQEQEQEHAVPEISHA